MCFFRCFAKRVVARKFLSRLPSCLFYFKTSKPGINWCVSVKIIPSISISSKGNQPLIEILECRIVSLAVRQSLLLSVAVQYHPIMY